MAPILFDNQSTHYQTFKDMKTRILNLIKNCSYGQVESMLYMGQLRQIDFEAYTRVWDWITPRFGGITGWKHDQFWKKHGKDQYTAKINRVRAAFGLELIKL